MHDNERGQNQSNKRKHSRIFPKIFYVVSKKDYHQNYHRYRNCKDKCMLRLIVLERNFFE
jgi:hypothetical protein